MSIHTEQDKKRIASIATRFLVGMIEKKEVNPDDEAAMEKALKKCVHEATIVYNAALEYVSG